MTLSRIIKLVMATISTITTLNAYAMSPGVSLTYWEPDRVKQISKSEARELKAAKCLITSERWDDGTPKRKGNKPDQNDYFMLVRGEFVVKGQIDLIVLCQAVDSNMEFFYIVWGGEDRCPEKLPMDNISRYMEKFGPRDDYYGAQLRGLPPSKVIIAVNSLYEEYEKKGGKNEYGYNFEYWRVDKQSIPVINHDAMLFSGKYTSIFFCNGKNWVQLLDVFTNATD